MISNYTKPQLVIRQVLQRLADPVVRTLNASVVGPQFDLFRYTNVAERAAMVGSLFVENSDSDPDERQLLPYEGLNSRHIVDESFVKVYGEYLEGQLWAAASPAIGDISSTAKYSFKLLGLDTPNKLRVVRRGARITCTYEAYSGAIVSAAVNYGSSGYSASTAFDVTVVGGTGSGAVLRLTTNSSGAVTAASVISPGTGYTANVLFDVAPASGGANVGVDDVTLISELYGRAVKSGDILYATHNGGTNRRSIKTVEKEWTDAHFGSDDAKTNKALAASLLNPTLATAASFTNTSAPSDWQLLLARSTARTVAFDQVVYIQVTAAGSGYTSTPTVSIKGISTSNVPVEGSGATARAVISGAALVGVIVTNPGSGYILPPKILITGGGGSGATAAAVIGSVGANYTEAPEVFFSEAAPIGGSLSWPKETAIGTATLEDDSVSSVAIGTPGAGYVRGGVVNVVIGAAGTDYVTAPIVTVSAPTEAGHTAVIQAVISGGGVTGFEIIDPGSGYTTAPSLTLSSGGGSGATMTATINVGVVYAAVTNGGSGYGTTPPTITFAAAPSGGETATGVALLVGGVVTAIKITKSGSGYLTPPAITVGSGSAAATAYLGTSPAVSFSAEDGSTPAFGNVVVRSSADDWSGLVEGSILDGKYGEKYTLTVTRGGSGVDDGRVRIRSASGGFSAENVPVRHAGYGYIVETDALGGLGIELRGPAATSALQLGQQFSFSVFGKFKPLDVTGVGQLTEVVVTAGGTGYTPGNYSLTISAPPAGGVQATATTTVTGAGLVQLVTITNPGSGYLVPPVVTLTGAGAGTNLVLTAIISTPDDSRALTPTQAGIYTGPQDTRYRITVVEGVESSEADPFTGAVVRVTDSAGIDAIQEYTITHGQEYNLGTYGLRFKFPTQTKPAQAKVKFINSTGALDHIVVESAGSGYTSTPTGRPVHSAGTGGAVALFIANGRVIGGSVTTAGSGYTGSSTPIEVDPPVTYQRGLRTGDVFYVDAVARAQTGVASVIVLNGQATDVSGWSTTDAAVNQFDIDYRVLYSGIIDAKRHDAPNLGYEVGDNADGGVFLTYNLKLNVTDRDSQNWVPVKESDKGRLFVHWRGLVPATSADVYKLYNVESDIIAKFGLNDPDNPLCYGAIRALRGGQGKAVWLNRPATNDVAGYTALLKQAERIDGLYSIGVVSEDLTIQNLVKSHVDKTSQPEWKLWRRAYVGTQNPGPYAVMTVDDENLAVEATVLSNGVANLRVVCEDANFISRGIRAGDVFRTNYSFDEWNDATWEEYVIADVTEEDELLLVTGPTAAINPAVKFEIWRPDDGLSQAEFVGSRSVSFADRRVINVWTDSPFKFNDAGNLLQTHPMYLAAEIAGLRAALLPQQGLTYTELDHSVDKATLMFTKYTQEEMNVAAAKGTLIVTQDSEDGPCYIRHQLTTDTSSGSLYYEDSVGANLDAVSYALKDVLQPYIGKRNATPETVEEIQTRVRDVLNTFKQAPDVSISRIGAAVINWSDLKVEIDSVLRDRINISVKLELPLPINNITVTLYATTIQDDTLAASQVAAAA